MTNTPKKPRTHRETPRRNKTPLKNLGARVNSAVGKANSSIRRKSPPQTGARKGKTPQAVQPPPVMARGYHMDVPFQNQSSFTRKVRRRIDLPLATPGAEMRLPSLPRWRVVSRWLGFGLLIGLISLVYFLWKAPVFRVDAAQVEGSERMSPAEINLALGISGESIFMLRSNKLEQQLKAAFPEFSTVDVRLALPNKLNVVVAERVPVLTWSQGGTNQLIDQQGYAFPFRPAMVTGPIPMILAAGDPPGQNLAPVDAAAIVAESAALTEEGGQQAGFEPEAVSPSKTEPLLQPEMVSAILAISKALPPSVAILYDPEHGLGWQDEGGWQVYLGDGQDMDVKLKVYEAIVARLDSEDVMPSLISVEHVHNPYFRAEQNN